QLLIQPKELCRVQSCGPQAFGRSETGLDEQDKFVMQAEARKTIWITCVCSCEKWNACPTHLSYDLNPFLKSAFSVGLIPLAAIRHPLAPSPQDLTRDKFETFIILEIRIVLVRGTS